MSNKEGNKRALLWGLYTRSQRADHKELLVESFMDDHLYQYMANAEGKPEKARPLLQAFMDIEERIMIATGQLVSLIDIETQQTLGGFTVVHSDNIKQRNKLLNSFTNTWPYYRAYLTPAHRHMWHRYSVNMSANAWIEEMHSTVMGNEPHLYVIMIATRKGMEGRGIGSDMMRGLCELADSMGIAVYLEATHAELLHFYGKFGFVVAPGCDRTILDLEDAPMFIGCVRQAIGIRQAK
ncbi:Acetyltransferase (GNAT) family [Carpediemonas membranifera]|uniref:Acetyltransferase (GNAT) family n=1 Tax=Carpediemonas membranifera TaxID=201153 RepID=A0A8J6DZZ5_9EUKA|nr:Acetyltransferase (GNAT) family [Carpediemonas membranifera]|eukprot:KAG9394329.1 Acetyltransferase (GNAT) family [Carpediemonas membranifera]